MFRNVAFSYLRCILFNIPMDILCLEPFPSYSCLIPSHTFPSQLNVFSLFKKIITPTESI